MNRYELLDACFPDGYSRFGSRLAEERAEDGSVLAHLDYASRRVVVGMTTVNVIGISNLCVDPDYRRQGRASSLIRAVHDELRGRLWVSFAALFDREGLPGLFEPLGYRKVEGGPEGFLVADLADDPWPVGPIEIRGSW